MRVKAVLVAGCLLTMVACSGSSGRPVAATSSSSTSASSTSSSSTSTVASTSASSSTTATPSTTATAVATPVIASLPPAPCLAVSGPPLQPEITFTSGGRLYATFPDGTNARCLYQLNAAEAGPIRWGPQADRVLLGPANVAVGDSVNPSGFFATNGDVKWSLPEGTRTFAATVDGRLKKRGLTDFSPEDISFLAYHEASVYHPAGRAVVSVGTVQGTYGIFLADNNGRGSIGIAYAESASKITEPTFDQSGSTLYFIARHQDPTARWHVHSEGFPDLTLSELYDSSRPLSDLVASTVGDALAVRAGGCDAEGATMLLRPFVADISSAPVFAGVVTKPVGFLDDGRLVVERFAQGCGRPAEIWIVHVWASVGNPVDAQLLVAGVDQAAVRIVHGPFLELPVDINPQAPG